MEAIQMTQDKNAVLLWRAEKVWEEIHMTLEIEQQIYTGYRPGPVVDMTWLGVGELASS